MSATTQEVDAVLRQLMGDLSSSRAVTPSTSGERQVDGLIESLIRDDTPTNILPALAELYTKESPSARPRGEIVQWFQKTKVFVLPCASGTLHSGQAAAQQQLGALNLCSNSIDCQQEVANSHLTVLTSRGPHAGGNGAS